MRDQEHGTSPPQPFDRLGDDLGAPGPGCSGLVQDHEGRVAEERAGKRDPLELSGGERAPTVPDDRVVAARERANERVCAGELRGVAHALVVGRRVAEPDVRRDGAAEERRPLWHPGDLRPPSRGVAVGEVDAADEERPAAGSAKRSRSAATVLLPLPLAPTSATVSPGSSWRSIDSRTARPAPGRRTRTLRVGRARPAGSEERRDPVVTTAPASSRSRSRPATARPSALAWILRGEVPQRQVELGREHQHRQARLEAEARRRPDGHPP